jgi:hypothetical protein
MLTAERCNFGLNAMLGGIARNPVADRIYSDFVQPAATYILSTLYAATNLE